MSVLLRSRGTPICDPDRLARPANCNHRWEPNYQRRQPSKTKGLAGQGCSGMRATFLQMDAELSPTRFLVLFLMWF